MGAYSNALQDLGGGHNAEKIGTFISCYYRYFDRFCALHSIRNNSAENYTMNSPESSEVYKDYDALRCENCNEIMMVPHDVFVFECLHCNHMHEFVLVEEDD